LGRSFRIPCDHAFQGVETARSQAGEAGGASEVQNQMAALTGELNAGIEQLYR